RSRFPVSRQRQRQQRILPVEYVHEHGVSALRRYAPAARRNRTGTRAVDRATIRRGPSADFPEPLLGFGRDRAIGSRTDVEQEIGALPRGSHDATNQLAHRYELMLAHVESPRIAPRERGFERQ